MTEKKLKCAKEDYELLKDVRYEYNKVRTEIEKIEKKMEELSQQRSLEEVEFSITIRQERLRGLNDQKRQLNDLLEKLETKCFGEERKKTKNAQ